MSFIIRCNHSESVGWWRWQKLYSQYTTRDIISAGSLSPIHSHLTTADKLYFWHSVTAIHPIFVEKCQSGTRSVVLSGNAVRSCLVLCSLRNFSGNFSIVAVDDVQRLAGTEEWSVSPLTESLLNDHAAKQTAPRWRQTSHRNLLQHRPLCLSEVDANACARIFVQQSQMSRRTEVACSPGGV